MSDAACNHADCEPKMPAGSIDHPPKQSFNQFWEDFMLLHHLDTKVPQRRFKIDLEKLLHAVLHHGGAENVSAMKKWASIGKTFNPPASMSDLSFQVKKLYSNKLQPLENAWRAGQIDLSQYDIPPANQLQSVCESRNKRTKAEKNLKKSKRKISSTPTSSPIDQSSAVASPSTAPATADKEEEASRKLRLPRFKHRHTTFLSPNDASHHSTVARYDLVGKRIGVYWPDENLYFFGAVNRFDTNAGRHEIVYDDGDIEWLKLDDEVWVLQELNPSISGAAALAQKIHPDEDAARAMNRGASSPSHAADVTAPATTTPPPPGITRKKKHKPEEELPTKASAPPNLLESINGTRRPSNILPLSNINVIDQGEDYKVYKIEDGVRGYEIYSDFWGFVLEEIAVKCYRRGIVQLKGAPKERGQGVTRPPASKSIQIQLPTMVDVDTAHALLSTYGQLYLRVNSVDSNACT